MRALYSLEVKWGRGGTWEFFCAFERIKDARDVMQVEKSAGHKYLRIRKWVRP
jgi:arabinogalactan endo-1,4-beta-galactosidase